MGATPLIAVVVCGWFGIKWSLVRIMHSEQPIPTGPHGSAPRNEIGFGRPPDPGSDQRDLTSGPSYSAASRHSYGTPRNALAVRPAAVNHSLSAVHITARRADPPATTKFSSY